MPEAPQPVTLQSKILYNEKVSWRELQFIQQEDFKELSPSSRARLKWSIITHAFLEPFKVWKDPASEIIYCLDGRHRTMILQELASEGADIPDLLPATFIDCADKTEAAKLVLVFSSIYAKITESGLQDFREIYNLPMDELDSFIDLPYLKLDINHGVETGSFDDEGIGVKNQYGVIVICTDEKAQEVIFKKLSEEGYECKIVVT